MKDSYFISPFGDNVVLQVLAKLCHMEKAMQKPEYSGDHGYLGIWAMYRQQTQKWISIEFWMVGLLEVFRMSFASPIQHQNRSHWSWTRRSITAT